MKTKIIWFICSWLLLLTWTFAWDLASFIVSVDPSTVKVWEPMDLDIKAVDSDWKVLTNYQWDILIMVKDGDNELSSTDYSAPNDGTYSFTEQDMWEKKFTKWLIINKAWSFTVHVEDFDTSKWWDTDVKVVTEWTKVGLWKVDIISPQKWETITSSTVTINWSATDYKNSKIKVLLDWKKVQDGILWSDGSFQVDLSSVSNWDHKLEVDVLDINDKVIAKSDELSFKVAANKILFKWIELLPSETVDQGTKVVVNITTDISVSSAVLTVEWYGDYPMDSTSPWNYKTEFVANTPWKFNLSLKLSTSDGEKNYSNIKELNVVEKIAIWNVKFVRDNSNSKINLDWKFTWQIPKFKVEYWTEKWVYTNSWTVSKNKFNIEKIDPAKTYFVKIIPVDSNWNKIWDESKEIVIESNMKKSASCSIDNIKTKVVIRWGKHYFVWKKAPWAVKYLIFKWDKKDNLIQVTSTTWYEYELPYDKNSKKDKYAYFTVKAVCDDGTMEQIDKVKKVKVWPMDWLLYALIIAVMIYWIKLSYTE